MREVEKGVNKNLRLPRMLIQLLVENGIKHGLASKTGQKILKVHIRTEAGKTIIAVEDNGLGRKAAKKRGTDSGKGINLINDMIRLHRKMGGKEITMAYTDLYDKKEIATGTRVEVKIPEEEISRE